MPRKGYTLFLIITAAWLVLMYPQSIFADRSCSLTVHSYISQSSDAGGETHAEEQGVPDDASPLAGAVYSLWKVGDVVSKTLDGTVTYCACNMNDEFMELLIPDDRSSGSINADEDTYYRLAEIQDAWDKVGDEAALTDLARSFGSALPSSGADGITQAGGLSAGLYVLAITAVPERDDLSVLSGHAPILLTLPQLNTASIGADGEIEDPDDLWIYDVSVYPKSRTLKSGKKILLTDGTPGDADDREIGSTITFISYVNLPDLGNDANYDNAVLDDTMTDGLSHKVISKVVCGAWLMEEEMSRSILDTYKELSPETDYTVSGGEHGFTLSLTDEGLREINAFAGNSGVYVIYDVLMGPEAAVGTEGLNANESEWTVGTDRTGTNCILRSPPVRASAYGIDLIKTGLSNASEARFRISRGDSIVYFDETGSGTYTVSGTDSSEGSLSSLAPAPDGHLCVRGLDAASYTFTEIKTEPGHSLLPSPFTVTLAGDSASGSLARAELKISGSDSIPLTVSENNGGIARVSVSNEGMITPLKAGDNGYVKTAALIFVFGSMLLGALLFRKHRLGRGDEDP